MPALLDHVGQQPVEQRDVGAGLDVEMQHVLLARRLLGHGDGDRPARVDDHELRAFGRLAGEPLLLLADALPGQIRNPVREEVVGLRLVRVRADGDDGVGDLRVLVRVVELTHPHVARRVALGVVGGAIVDADHLGPEGREHELAAAPGVLEATSRSAVVEAVEHELVGPVLVEDALGEPPVDGESPVPRGVDPVVTGGLARVLQPVGADAVRGVHHGGELPAPGGRQPLIHRAILVRQDHDVVSAPVPARDHVVHRRRHHHRQGGKLGAEVEPEGVLLRRASAFAVRIPLVDVIAASDDAEMTRHERLLGVRGRQRNSVLVDAHRLSSLTGCWRRGRR